MSEKKEKREVCFIMPSLEGGGAERVTSILCNRFVEDGYRVTIYLLDRAGVEYSLDERITVDKSLISNKRGLSRAIRRIAGIRKVMLQKPDAQYISFISMHNLYTMLAAIGIKRDIIVSERLDPQKSIPDYAFLHKLRNILYSKAKNVVFQTPDAMSFFPETIQRKGLIIVNPLKENLPDQYSGIRRKAVVTFARLEQQKNYPLLIEAFEKFSKIHPDYTLEIYGKGIMEETLKQMVVSKNLEDKVQFLGFCSSVHTQTLDAAMFVLPSDYEGLSNSMLEAMAIGLPVICTDCPPGGARMMIQNKENGLLTSVGDVESLCQAMCYMADNPDRAQEMGQEATKVREKLSLDAICTQWENLIDA